MALSQTELLDQNRAEVPTQTVTHNPWGNLINKCLATRRPFVLPQWTTLNEVYGRLASTSIGNRNGGDYTLKYFTIGVGGSDADGKNVLGGTKLKVNQHSPLDGNLFIPIPFACRPVTNDFDNTTRLKYRMRVVEEINGVKYAFYWLKLINFDSYNPSVVKIKRDENNQEVPIPFVPAKDDLINPTPKEFTSEGSVPVSNEYMNSSAILDCSLNQADLDEIANACRIKWGDASLGAVNEVGVCYGIDTANTSGELSQGATISYTEARSVVIAHYVTERDSRNALNNVRLQLAFDHGASEPMLLHTVATVTP